MIEGKKVFVVMASKSGRDAFMDEKELMGIHLTEKKAEEHVLKGRNSDDGYYYYFDEVTIQN